MSELRERFIDEVSWGVGEFMRVAMMVAIAKGKDPGPQELCDAMRELTEIMVEDVQEGGMDEALGEVYRLLGVGDE